MIRGEFCIQGSPRKANHKSGSHLILCRSEGEKLVENEKDEKVVK